MQQLAAFARRELGHRSGREVRERRQREIELGCTRARAKMIGEPAASDREQKSFDVHDHVALLDAREKRLRDQIRAVVADLRAKEPRDARPVAGHERIASGVVAGAPALQ
jgi:hypothetical protein